MEARLQLRIQRYGWDAAAPHYHDSWRAQLLPAQEALIDLADLQPGHRVLETACGTGMVTEMAARAIGLEGALLATDLSEQMVAETGRRCRQEGLAKVESRPMSAEVLEIEDDSFDRALCALGLMYMPDPRAALREMKRVLRPGGRVAVLVWGERRHCGWAEIFPIVDAKVQSEVCPLFFALGAPGALVSALQAAEFKEVEERREQADLHFANDGDMLQAVIEGGAVALAAKRFTEETRREVDAAFLNSVAAHRNGAGFRLPAEFVLATGIA